MENATPTETHAPDVLPSGIKAAPQSWGQLAKFSRWLVENLKLDDAFDAVTAPAQPGPSRKAESLGEIARRKQAESAPDSRRIAVPPALLWRAIADAEAAHRLANVLFVRTDGQSLDADDWARIPRGCLNEELFTLFLDAEQFTGGLLGVVPTAE